MCIQIANAERLAMEATARVLEPTATLRGYRTAAAPA
jgi:hypothetical protein